MKQRGFGLITLITFVALIIIGGALLWKNAPTTNFPPKTTPYFTSSPTPSPDYSPSPKTLPEPVLGILNVTDVTSNREAYVSKKIKVRGKLEVLFYIGERPCVTNEPCNTEIRPPTLHVVNPNGNQWGKGNSIDLYKKVADGKYEQFSCKSTNGETADCLNYKQGTIATVEGVFTKDKIPSKTEVLQWQDIYFLVVD